MDAALLVARVLLAAVFAVAGFAKLADLQGSRKAMGDFGVPAMLARPLGLLLPLAELAVAVALLPVPTAWWGALGALVLLLLFVAGIGLNLARGNRPDCHCFGQLSSAPAGPSTLIRNGVLALVAAFVLARGPESVGPSVLGWLGALTPFEQLAVGLFVVGFGLLVAEGWFLLHVLRQNGRLLLRLDSLEQRLAEGGAATDDEPVEPHRGLPLGSTAPEFALTGIHGETMTLGALRAADKPVLLLFMDSGCGPCNALMPDVGSWQREHAAKFTVAIVTRGKVEANRAKSAEHGIVHVLLQLDREVSTAYRAHGTPSIVLVRPDGTIGSVVAAGSEAIRKLVGRTAGVLPMAPQAAVRDAAHGGNGAGAAAPERVGQPAPEVVLPDLDGEQVSLADLRGSDTLVLFWNPGCGFCQRMLPDLRAWESTRPPTAPALLVISSGATEVNREQGLLAPVLLDQGFSAGRAFGVTGTPSAVLVDAEGKIASSAAVGAQSVLALAAGRGAAGLSA